MKKKVRILSFRNTLKMWQVWVSAFSYHITSLFINNLLPEKTAQSANKIIYQKIETFEIPKVVDLAEIGASKPVYFNPAIYVNLFLFDSIFIVLLLIVNKYLSHKLNIYALIIIILLTNIVFALYFQTVKVAF